MNSEQINDGSSSKGQTTWPTRSIKHDEDALVRSVALTCHSAAREGITREFKDVVFDNNSFVTRCCGNLFHCVW